MARKRTGPYLIQAAIADLHLHQPRDWPQIAALYQTLARQTGSPVAEMNRAIAVAEIDGPEAGLAILDRLDLDHYRYFHSTRADLLRRAGRDEEAHHAYRRALDLAQTEPEQRFLADRLAETAPAARDAHRLPADRDCGQLPPRFGSCWRTARAWPVPAAGSGRRAWPRARSLCLECSVRLPGQERTGSPVSNVDVYPFVEDRPP